MVGFVCSGGLGTVHIFEKTDEKELFKKVKEIRIPADQQSADPSQSCNQQITCIALSPSEETIVSSSNGNQLYSIPLSSTDLGKVRTCETHIYTFDHPNIFHRVSILVRSALGSHPIQY